MTTTAFDVADALNERVALFGEVQKQKLLYYCQAWHLAWFGEPMFDEVIVAWHMGPVVEDVWRAENRGLERPPSRPLSSTHTRTIERVCNRYGTTSGQELARRSHSERPWKTVWEFPFSDVISHDLLRESFVEQDAEQGWFWDDAWIAGEKEADSDIRAGNVERFYSADEFLKSL